MTPAGHVVWDWNGTLLDDFSLTIEAVNRSVAGYGVGAITAERYRDHFTRPVKRFYEAILDRAVPEAEWEEINTVFHDHYFELARTARLAADALAAIDLLDHAGWTQSLLSMAPHDWLLETAGRLGVDSRFVRIDGMTAPLGGRKAPFMEAHLALLAVHERPVVVIGDTPDDADAAHHVGATPVLFDGGSHHTAVLGAGGVAVHASLLDAVRAVTGAESRRAEDR